MAEVTRVFETLCQLNQKHGLDITGIVQAQTDMENQKVTIPIIGKFSAGKSALINALLDCRAKLLREDITPETAVPTEIAYFDYSSLASEDSIEGDQVTLQYEDSVQTCRLKEYVNEEVELNYERLKTVHISLSNKFLRSIPDVMIVDMPGYDSGYEVHNRAIDYYLPRSLAYIIAFPAEEIILKQNMIGTLKELLINDTPICVVITKRDKVTDEIFENNFQKLKADLLKHLGKNDFTYCVTSSQNREVEELKQFLLSIQEQSQEIIDRKYRRGLAEFANNTSLYLSTQLQNQDFSISELAEKEARLKGELEQLNKQLNSDSDSLEKNIPKCVNSIKNDIFAALSAETDTFITMIINKQDISEQVNCIVRATVTQSVKKYFVTMVERYIKNISQGIRSMVSSDLGISMDNINTKIDGSLKVAVSVSAGLAGYALASFLLTPLGAIIVGALAAIGGALFGGNKKSEKLAEAKRELRTKLSREFENIANHIAMELETKLRETVDEINKAVSEELKGKYDTAASALEILSRQKDEENTEKERAAEGLASDLDVVKELIYECGR